MADKKVQYTHYSTEWDKTSYDEKQDKKHLYKKSNYTTNSRNNNNYAVMKTLLKKYKYKAKRAFDENELKELFKSTNYNEEQINKEIEFKLKEINEKGFEFGWHKVTKGKKQKPTEQIYNPSHTHENFGKGLQKETNKEYPYESGNLNTISSRTGYKDRFYKSGGNWSKRETQRNNNYNYYHKELKTQRRPFTKAFEVPSDPNYNWGENIKIAIEKNKKDMENEEKKKQSIKQENKDTNENECEIKDIESNNNDDNNEICITNKDKTPVSRNENSIKISYSRNDSPNHNVNSEANNNKELINNQQDQIYEDINNTNNNNNIILPQNENNQIHSRYTNINLNDEEPEDAEEEEEDDEEEEEEDDDTELGMNSVRNENMSPEKKNLLRKYYLEKLKVYSSQKNTKNKKSSLPKLSEQTSFYTIKSLANTLFLSIIVEERNHKGGIITEYVFPFTLDDLKEKDIIFSKCNSIEETQKVISPLLKGKMSFKKEDDYIDLYLIVFDKKEERKILFRLFPQIKDGGMFNQFQKILLKLNSKVLQYEDEIKILKEALANKK